MPRTATLAGHEFEGNYPPGSCWSCGGTVQSWSKLPRYDPVERCPNCGPVQWVVLYDHHGKPRQGFMTPEDSDRLGTLRLVTDKLPGQGRLF